MQWDTIWLLSKPSFLFEALLVRILANTNNFEVPDKIAVCLGKRYALIKLLLILFAAMLDHNINRRRSPFNFNLLLGHLLFQFFARIEVFFVPFLTHNNSTVDLKLLLPIILEMGTNVLLRIVRLVDVELGYRHTSLAHLVI